LGFFCSFSLPRPNVLKPDRLLLSSLDEESKPCLAGRQERNQGKMNASPHLPTLAPPFCRATLLLK